MRLSAATAKESAPLYVMVVDDEPLIRWSLAETLGDGAFGHPRSQRGALDLGAFRVVNKPFELHDLAAQVHEAHGAGCH